MAIDDRIKSHIKQFIQIYTEKQALLVNIATTGLKPVPSVENWRNGGYELMRRVEDEELGYKYVGTPFNEIAAISLVDSAEAVFNYDVDEGRHPIIPFIFISNTLLPTYNRGVSELHYRSEAYRYHLIDPDISLVFYSSVEEKMFLNELGGFYEKYHLSLRDIRDLAYIKCELRMKKVFTEAVFMAKLDPFMLEFLDFDDYLSGFNDGNLSESRWREDGVFFDLNPIMSFIVGVDGVTSWDKTADVLIRMGYTNVEKPRNSFYNTTLDRAFIVDAMYQYCVKQAEMGVFNE